ncbi:MAG: insulinase family protein [Firmicutes bacterium]|jgi:predicted Zn-dependent peptidase|nr:insulinase family protein [Bacillota bacterium]
MTGEILRQERLDERIHQLVLPSGLKISVLPRPGFTKTYATFATHYGSIDNAFKVPDETRQVAVPDGIAHFLEHKMFEKADGGDVFDDFGRYGASSNAYTDYTSTTFLFSTTENVEENLEILLDFVQRPYFTEDNVNKEKGIIEQEIRMYLDMPGDRLHSNLMRALYQKNPVRIDVAGSVESIRTISPDDLYLCHRTFYHPSNMQVFVTGGVEAERILDQIVANQAQRPRAFQAPIERIYPEEPRGIAQTRIEQEMAVAAPLFMMGYKEERTGFSGSALLRREMMANLMWNALVGHSSEFFSRLYEKGLINDRFQAHYSCGLTFGFSAIGGETPDPKRLEAELVEGLDKIPLTSSDLERLKRRELGEYVSLFQNLEELAYVYNHLTFRGTNLFEVPEVIQSIRLEDIEGFRKDHLREAARAVSVILPKKVGT